ncbi:hypothetical protein [Labilithrix luteola]|nr:hypothetical protein [Labilithrix luteola]
MKLNVARVFSFAVLGTVTAAFGLACSASGAGSGELIGPATTTAATVPPVAIGSTQTGPSQGRVVFYWKSDGASWEHGTIRAELPGGRIFNGQYLEPATVNQTTVDTWMGWGCDWYSSCFGAYGPGYGTVTQYSGYILARLDDGGQTRMNCRFVLAEPTSGPKKGGQGVCELSTGERIAGAELHGE